MRWSERPVIVLGHGVRLGGAVPLVQRLMNFGIPVLTSWPAADLVDSDHPAYFGRPGVYGQRCANKVLAHADMILTIGCRLSIWTVGYDFPMPHQRLVMADVDGKEARKFRGAEWVQQDAATFIEDLLSSPPPVGIDGWRIACNTWRTLYPWLESPHHDSTPDFINPHRFMARLQQFLRPDECIVADCATGSLCAHQILRLRPPQRLMTSGGLGEMGCGLPAAIGASFASGRGEVICLNTDGSMMLNLQDLQTIAHHRLPVKIVVFENDGYGMIKATQKNLGYQRAGVDKASGVSFPDFCDLATAFHIDSNWLRFESDDRAIDHALEEMFRHNGPFLLQVSIDPEYQFGPKLNPIRNPDGTITNAKFDEMDPKL